MPQNSTATLQILHLEDDPKDAELVRSTLDASGIACNINVVDTRGEFEQAVKGKNLDLILSDYSLPSFSGKEAFEIANFYVPDVPFVFVSGTLGEDAAIQCLVDGAADYVLKTKMSRLVPAVQRAMKEAEAAKKLKLAEKQREDVIRELRISEARLRGVLESAPDSAIIVDAKGRIKFVNHQTERLFGFSRNELIDQDLGILIPPKFRNLHKMQVGEFAVAPHSRGFNSGLEILGRKNDGTEFPADIMLSPLKTDRDMAILAIIRDITSVKETEKSLRESERLFRGIFEDSPVAMTNLTRTGKIIRANTAAANLLGYRTAELRHARFNDFSHPDDRKIGMSLIRELMSGEKNTVQFEKRFLSRDGDTVMCRVTMSAIRKDDGNLKYAITVAQDITDMWRTEQSLRRSEERYRSLIENARDAIFTLSPSAIVLSLNPAFETLTGWKAEEWIGKSYTDLVHPDDRQRAGDYFKATLSGELTDVINFRIMKKSGEYAVGEFNLTGFVLEDGSSGVLGVARDVTSQIALEEQLRQSQKMESIGTLAGGVAHDFNNILGIIVGYTGLTLRSVGDNEKLANNLRAIQKAAQRGVELVRQLLMFARKQERVLRILDVNRIVNDAYGMIKETFPKVIAVNLRPSKEELPAECDQTEIHQAVLNLCTNARDAMMERSDGKRAGGTLNITTSSEDGDAVRRNHPSAKAEDYIRIEVSDTGSGMDEKTRERIFEPFFTTKNRGKGTGLGLATVYGIVSSYEGFIDVDSKAGSGTTFGILLPMRRKTSVTPALSIDRSGDVRGGSESLLVVEDEPGLRELLRNILSERGYNVFTAEDGERALALFRVHRDIDLVISDIGLPKVGGPDLFQAMKKMNPDLKVILVSGYVDDSEREKMIREGVNKFIQKPYETEDVLRKVRDVLDGI